MSELLSQWTASDGLNARKSISRKGSECLWLPTLHHPFHGILRSFRIRQLVGEVGAGGRRHPRRRSCILRSRSGRGAFSSPASRRGGYVHPVHSAGTLSLPILSRDVPDRWNWAGSRSLICIHGTRSRRALPAGWRQQSHSRRLLQTPDFPVESGLRAALEKIVQCSNQAIPLPKMKSTSPWIKQFS